MPRRGLRIKLNQETNRSFSEGSAGDRRPPKPLAAGLLDCHRNVTEMIMGFLGIPVYLSLASVSTQWRNAWGQEPTVTSRRWAVQSRSCLDWARACGLEIWDSPCLFAAAEGQLDVVQHAVALGYSREGMPICEWAAGGGHLDVVKWGRANRYPWGWSSIRAAEGGHLEVLKWCVANGCPVSVQRRSPRGRPKFVSPRGHYRSKQPYYEENVFDVFNAAVKGGHLETVKWCKNQGYPWSSGTSGLAAEAGHLDVIKWLRANGCPRIQAWSRGGVGACNLELLEWCKANDYSWDDFAVVAAAESGNLGIVKWFVANDPHRHKLGIALAGAAGQGHLEVVEWMRANRCPWGDQTCYLAACGGHLEVLKWCIANACPWGHPGGYVTCPFSASVSMMMWAASNGCPWMSRKPAFHVLCRHAARWGNLEVLQWCGTYQPLWSFEISREAALNGQVNILEWLRASGRLSDGGVGMSLCTTAARSGSLETVKWCRANNFPWGSLTSDEVMASGNLELLRWCRANGCPWGKNTSKIAILQGDIEALAWCLAHDCPMDVSVTRESFMNGYIEIIEWCTSRLPPRTWLAPQTSL